MPRALRIECASAIYHVMNRDDRSTRNHYHADGNGNITYLVNSSQTVAASYRYDPYANTISSSGSLASANVYRFSSKELHVNSGLYYYGYRWYHPNLQRWLNRDPLGEWGGINLYAGVANNPLDYLDPLGLSWFGDYMSDVGRGIYDLMMGDEPGQYNQDTYGAMRADLLGGIDRNDNVLRESMGQLMKELGVGGEEVAKAYAGGVVCRASRFFYDPRKFKSISDAYWKGHAGGNSLHHWFFPQRWKWVPEGIRNGGWNLLVLPRGFNSYMNGRGLSLIPEWGFRLGIPAAIGGAATWPILLED